MSSVPERPGEGVPDTSRVGAAASDCERTIGLLGATGIGVGAIVGGGILVLAGVAFASAGPSAILAFALNGLVAFLTAASVAEIATSFPESGGAYAFARRVLSVRAAFVVGWIIWFAYMVAGVLYALGFASYAALGIQSLWAAVGGEAPDWLASRALRTMLAVAATTGYALSLARTVASDRQWATVGKILIFLFLLTSGVVALCGRPVEDVAGVLAPFFSGGMSGLLAAMGFTFIAMQGFEIIAAVAGEVRAPARTIPRAMFLSLGGALAIYLPLLFLVSTVGVAPGDHISELSARQPETVVAVAVEAFLGQVGYWLVVVVAILSTLSALHANMLASSRIALSMARDRTLPRVLARQHSERKTPVFAIFATALGVVAILLMVPDLAAAAAAASLIFLISFALTHGMAVVARLRGDAEGRGFRTPWFPAVPVVGGLACLGLALFQGVMVPGAGALLLIWSGLGVLLYLSLFSQDAEIKDASAEASDPSLMRLRGRSPLVLLPIANPAHARAMVAVANALAPLEAGRVLLLSIVRVPEDADRDEVLGQLQRAQSVVTKALENSYGLGHSPEALITAAAEPWEEIRRVAEEHRCASLLIGLGDADENRDGRLVELLNDVDADVAVMRTVPGWRLDAVERVLVPVGGRGDQHEVRARLLASICRDVPRELTFVTVLPSGASEAEVGRARAAASRLADINVSAKTRVRVLRADDPARALVAEASGHDLLVLGLRSATFGRMAFGDLSLRVVREAPCAALMLSRRRYRAHELWQPLRDVVTDSAVRIQRPEWMPGTHPGVVDAERERRSGGGD